ncbi:MAG: hypothetical protein E7377_05835 [Clostridiales bacterium]|nr:hypothetical protein [Clostridiales bacterium]
MSENVTNGEQKENFFTKAWATVKGACVKAIDWVKNIPWFSNVKPLIAWSVFGGTVALAVILMLIFWL